MLNRPKVTLRTAAERAAARAEREEREREEQERILKSLDEWDWESGPRGGRPPIILPPEIAQRVLADVHAGREDRAIERKYRDTPWKFSARWLRRNVNNGKLHEMAGVRHSSRQNVAQKGSGQPEYEYVKGH